VALNIRYDTQSYFSGRFSAQDYDAVIKRGSAVCEGYADVFKHLCDALGIECAKVSGYARGASSNLFRFVDVTNSNHAWNIVTIGGKKFLIDTTWDAGHLSGRTFQASYRTAYLFTDPAFFIYNHFPLSNRNQLLDTPVNAEEFDTLPFIDPRFLTAFETWPRLSRITEINTGEERQFEFALKPGYQSAYDWRTQSGSLIGRSSTYPPRSYSVSLPNLKPGNYYLRLYIKGPGDSQYRSCADFGFVVK